MLEEITFSLEEVSYLNELIANIYEEEDKIESLKNFLEKLKPICFFEKADIYIFKKNSSHINFDMFIFSGWGEELNYYFNVCDIDDALPLVAMRQPITFRSSDVFIRSERRNSRYYRDCLEPCNMYYSIEGNLYEDSEEYICGMGLHRSNKYSDFTNKEVKIIKLCKPHLTAIVSRICCSSARISGFIDDMILNDRILAFALYNWDLNLIETNIYSREDLVGNGDTICNILYSMCNMLKQEKKNNTYSTINIGNKAYYLSVSLTNNKNSFDKQFSCFVYDYSIIIDALLNKKKEECNLTSREYEVLIYLTKGLNNNEISEKLRISMPTVKKHISSIYNKLDIEGRHQLFQSVFY